MDINLSFQELSMSSQQVGCDGWKRRNGVKGEVRGGGNSIYSTLTSSSIGGQAEARRWTQTAWPLFHVFTAVLAVGHGTRPRVCEKRHRLAFSPEDDKEMLTKERSLTPETWNVTRGMASEDKLHHLSPRWRSKWNLCRGGVLLAPWLILLPSALHLTVFRQSMHPSVTKDGISLSSYTRSFTSPDWSLLLAEMQPLMEMIHLNK